jgi:hypothetical protein
LPEEDLIGNLIRADPALVGSDVHFHINSPV